MWRMCCWRDSERDRRKVYISFAIHWRMARRSVWYVCLCCATFAAIIFGRDNGRAVVWRTATAIDQISNIYLFFSQKSNHMLVSFSNATVDPIEFIDLLVQSIRRFYQLQINISLGERGTETKTNGCACVCVLMTCVHFTSRLATGEGIDHWMRSGGRHQTHSGMLRLKCVIRAT